MSAREALGTHTRGYQFGVLLNIVAMALNNAWQPFFYQNAAEGGHDTMISSFITYQVALMTLLALAVALLAPEVIRIIATPAVWSAAAIVPGIAVGYVARDLYFFPVNSLLFKKRRGWVETCSRFWQPPAEHRVEFAAGSPLRDPGRGHQHAACLRRAVRLGLHRRPARLSDTLPVETAAAALRTGPDAVRRGLAGGFPAPTNLLLSMVLKLALLVSLRCCG